MLLDDYDNIKKSNCPIAGAMTYYDTMLKGKTHWLVDEIKAEIPKDLLFKDVSGNRVPTEDFFVNRRSRLIAYFKAITASPSLTSTTTRY